MHMVRIFGLGRISCIPLQIFTPKENSLFPSLKNWKKSDFSQLENKTNFEMEKTVQPQVYKHNLSVFHRQKKMWIYSVLAIRINCMAVSSWMLTCLFLHDTGEEEKAWWEFRGGSGKWREVFPEVTNLGAYRTEFFHK